jgi:hypothetical protein
MLMSKEEVSEEESSEVPGGSSFSLPVVVKHVPDETWASMKKLFVSGVADISELSSAVGLPDYAVMKRIADEGWVRDGVAQESMEDKSLRLFNSVGFTEGEAFMHIVNGIRTAEHIRFEGKGDEMIATPEADHEVRLKYIKMYLQVTGKLKDGAAQAPTDGGKHIHFHTDPEALKNGGAAGAARAYMQELGGR